MGKHLFLFLAFVSITFQVIANGNDELSDFVVYSKKNLITIQWKAFKTEDSKPTNYCIQRSHDGVNFETILCVSDQGSLPNMEEFVETDFNPLPGWSYYRLVKFDNEVMVQQSAVATVFFGLDRIEKGKVIAPSFSHMLSTETVDLATFNNTQYVFVLRSSDGQEFYIKSDLFITENDQLTITTNEDLPTGIYRIASCSNEGLIGLDLSVNH